MDVACEEPGGFVFVTSKDLFIFPVKQLVFSCLSQNLSYLPLCLMPGIPKYAHGGLLRPRFCSRSLLD